MAIRFIHAADLHLDTPFTTRARYPESVAGVLRDASLGAFARLVDAAVALEVDFVVVAGDVYDGAERGVRAQLRFRDGLTRLAESGIRTFVAHGNHDPVEEGWSAIDRFPDLVTVFPPGETASVGFDTSEGPVTVHGISYPVAHVTENLSRRFDPATTAGLHVGVLHANVGADPAHDLYSPCSVDDLAALGYHYWALGHIHSRRVLQRDPWIVYPGNLQGRSVRASEQGPKGALLVDVHHGRIAEPELLPLDLVRFAVCEVDATELDFDGLLTALAAAGDAARSEADGRSVLLSATILGRGGLHQRLNRSDLAAEILAELREQNGTAEPFLWWDAISVAARPTIDRSALAAGDGFMADVLATAEGLRQDPTHPAQEQWVHGLTPEILRMVEHHEPLPTIVDLWSEATDLAIDLLSGDEAIGNERCGESL